MAAKFGMGERLSERPRQAMWRDPGEPARKSERGGGVPARPTGPAQLQQCPGAAKRDVRLAGARFFSAGSAALGPAPVIMKVTIPVETGNRLVLSGKMGAAVQMFMEDVKPEAAYFTEDSGRRCGYLFVDVDDPAVFPALAEPAMLAFNASVEFRPLMTPEEFAKAAPAIAKSVDRYKSL
jgi:hypothetical protein